MSIHQDYYIKLPSNTNSKFHENTLSNYTTILKKRLNFPANKDWRCGLAEISYTKSWFNVSEDRNLDFFVEDGTVFRFTDPSSIILVEYNPGTYEYVKPTKVCSGHYSSPSALIEKLNKWMKNTLTMCQKIPQLVYNDVKHTVKLNAGKINKFVFFPDFGEEIENILGLVNKEGIRLRLLAKWQKAKITKTPNISEVFKKEEFNGTRCVDLANSKTHFYIYSNIIEHSLVGDEHAQLLRIIPIKNDAEFGATVCNTFSNPYLIPLQSKTFDTIEIDIRDDTGNNIQFEFGRVIITLLLRRYE